MKPGKRVVRVAAALLTDRGLSPPAKLVAIVLRPGGGEGLRLSVLEGMTGLSAKTVRRALKELVAGGWLAAGSRQEEWSSAGVVVPVRLLQDGRVGVRARILYGCLQLLPDFRHPEGRFRYGELSDLTGQDPKTVRTSVRELVAVGWLGISQRNRLAPVHFRLRDPFAERAQAEVDQARRRLERARFLGEALMREYLSLLVDSEDFEDDAAPGFLVNPLTGERMELDRFYPPAVAFEFNGPQHYGATELFNNDEEAARQRARDYMKLGICASRGIKLIVVHPQDLTLAGMRRKIGSSLPVRDEAGHEPWAGFLESVARRYRLAARRRVGRQP